MTLEKKAFENFVGKGENAGKQHFLRFLQCFLSYQGQILTFQLHIFYRNLDQSEKLPFGKELSKLKTYADDKLNLANMIIYVFDSVENMWANKKMLVISSFSFSHKVFKRHLPLGR